VSKLQKDPHYLAKFPIDLGVSAVWVLKAVEWFTGRWNVKDGGRGYLGSAWAAKNVFCR